jgi:hypothetical protein
MSAPVYEYRRIQNAPGFKDTFATIERRSRVTHECTKSGGPEPEFDIEVCRQCAVFTLCKRDAGGFHVLVLSRKDKGWHVIGWFLPPDRYEPLDFIQDALRLDQITTGNVDAWA